jgi:hypothetical protein
MEIMIVLLRISTAAVALVLAYHVGGLALLWKLSYMCPEEYEALMRKVRSPEEEEKP